ncbi:MAG: hypothetical protein JW869_01485 [Candidatus Omnitrophica bacterium]|nr:hypothetical protein [Candidatus Omnitrophota bacterium]
MVALVKLLGILILAAGVVFFVRQDLMKKSWSLAVKKNNLYVCAVISILFGIVMLLAASRCQVRWYVILMGIIALLKGIGIIVLGPDKMKDRIKWLSSRSAGILRLFAISALVIGGLLIYAA